MWSTKREFDERRNTSRTFQPDVGAADAIRKMEGACRECGHRNPVPACVCLWCHDLKLLAGGFIPDRLEERWTDEELTLLKSRAASRAAHLRLDQHARRAAKRAVQPGQQARIGAPS